eukprot:439071_1
MNFFPHQNVFIVALTIFDAILTIAIFIINLRLLKFICFKVSGEITNQRLNKLLIFISLITVTLFTISALLMLAASITELHLLMTIVDTNLLNKNRLDIGLQIGGICLYFLAETSMIFTFILRINKIFGETEFSLTNTCDKLFFIATVILMILGCIMGITFLIQFDFISLNNQIMFTAAFCSWALMQFIVSISLIILFVRKINKTLTIQIKSQLSEKVNSVDTSEIMKQIVNNGLVDVIIRHFLLIPIAIISTLIFPFSARILATRFNSLD